MSNQTTIPNTKNQTTIQITLNTTNPWLTNLTIDRINQELEYITGDGALIWDIQVQEPPADPHVDCEIWPECPLYRQQYGDKEEN